MLFNLKKFWYVIVIFAIIFAMIGFTISKLQTPKYESQVQLLVIQKYGEQFDAFTAKRSAETLSETLSKVIYSSSYMNQVLSAPLDIKDTYPKEQKTRKKAWKKDIAVRVLESGNLEITVYSNDQRQAEQLAYGIAYIMVTKGNQYHGGAQQVEIKMIERPITSEKPVKPNIFLSTILGFIIGILTSMGLIFLLPEQKEQPKQKINFNPQILDSKNIKREPLKNKIKKYSQIKKPVKKFTGEEYSEEKVNEWIRSGKFNNR